jgi:hypothetical protein
MPEQDAVDAVLANPDFYNQKPGVRRQILLKANPSFGKLPSQAQERILSQSLEEYLKRPDAPEIKPVQQTAVSRFARGAAAPVGGMIGGALGGPPGAALGGTLGAIGKQAYERWAGLLPPPRTPQEVAEPILRSGIEQGALQLVPPFGRAAPAVTPETRAVAGLARQVPGRLGLTAREILGKGPGLTERIAGMGHAGRSIIRRAQQEGVEGMTQAVDRWMQGLSASEGLLAGRRGQRALEIGATIFKREAGKFYSEVDKQAGNIAIPLGKIQAPLQQLRRDMGYDELIQHNLADLSPAQQRVVRIFQRFEPQAPPKSWQAIPAESPYDEFAIALTRKPFAKLSPSEQTQVKEFAAKTGFTPEQMAVDARAPVTAVQTGTLSWKAAQQLRSELSEIAKAPEGEAMSTQLRKVAARGVDAVTKAMEEASKALNPRAFQAWQQANRFYRRGASLYEEDAVSRMLKADPEALAESVKLGQASNAIKIRSAMMRYLEHAEPGERRTIERGWNGFRRKWAETHLIGDDITKLKPNLAKAGDTARVLFGDAKGKEVLGNLSAVGEALSRMRKLGAGYGMAGRDVLWIGMNLARQHWQEAALEAAAFEGLPALLAKVAYRKGATEQLLRAIERAPTDRAGAAAQVARVFQSVAGMPGADLQVSIKDNAQVPPMPGADVR